MAILAGAYLDATDFTVPADVKEASGGDGLNTIVATSWAVLPTNPVTAEITNPHPELAMVVDAYFGAWLVGSGSGAGVRAGLDVSGSLTLSPGVGAGGAESWGEILYSSSTAVIHCHSMISLELPVSTTACTVKMHAYIDGGSGQGIRYATIRLVPRRFVESA